MKDNINTNEIETKVFGPLAILEGLQILTKYSDETDYAFEHDQCWFHDYEETITKMSDEDFIRMYELGWFEDENSWSHF